MKEGTIVQHDSVLSAVRVAANGQVVFVPAAAINYTAHNSVVTRTAGELLDAQGGVDKAMRSHLLGWVRGHATKR